MSLLGKMTFLLEGSLCILVIMDLSSSLIYDLVAPESNLHKTAFLGGIYSGFVLTIFFSLIFKLF